MELKLRKVQPADAQRCGEIMYIAFKTIAERHGFPADFSTLERSMEMMGAIIASKGFYGVVAESGGKIVGSNFLDERSTIAGIGPITIDLASQDRSVGRKLMAAVIDRATERHFPGVRLVQAAYHNRSLSLYTKLGFIVREPLALMHGKPPSDARPKACTVREVRDADLDACDRVCIQVHGHERRGELADSMKHFPAMLVERDGRVTGYATYVGFAGHVVGETNEDLKALISAAQSFLGTGFLLPTRNADLFRWCLENGLRVVQPMTLMSMGLYNEPAGAFLPSILY
jgi:L-amino acid N-acyltransferase YncA